jgi:hypothetical protein
VPLTTPTEICRIALKAGAILGVGQSPLAEDLSDAFDILNGMIAQWNRRRWLVYHLIDVVAQATGQQSYTVGPGGDFDTPRIDRLESAFFRQTTANPFDVDFILEILESREDYNQIRLKSLNSTLPRWIWMDTGWPLGTVFPWPIPMAGLGEIHLSLKATLGPFTSYTQSINVPPEYVEALWTNLAVRLGPIYQYDVRPDLARLAAASLATVRGANVQIPRLRMPRFLANRSRYDAWSDSTY